MAVGAGAQVLQEGKCAGHLEGEEAGEAEARVPHPLARRLLENESEEGFSCLLEMLFIHLEKCEMLLRGDLWFCEEAVCNL